MSSIAQEESRSISENTKWGIRKKFSDGKISLAYSTFLGYDKGPNGSLIINEGEAKLVRYIFSLFIQGKTVGHIARLLTKEGHPTPQGKRTWYYKGIISILTNEKYKGDALLQKSYTPDFLSKRPVPNKGELPQYYVKDSHEAIIEPEVFDLVQQELAFRKQFMAGSDSNHPFSGRIRCGDCQSFYGRKVWNSTSDKYRQKVWQCNSKYKNKNKFCSTPAVNDEKIKILFTKAVNMLKANTDEILKEFNIVKTQVLENKTLQEEVDLLQQERVLLAKEMEGISRRNASIALDQDQMISEFDKLQQRYANASERVARLEAQIEDQRHRALKTERFLSNLNKQEALVIQYSEELWFSLVDYVTVYAKNDIRFMFKNGNES